MVSMLISCVVDHGFEPWSDQTKDFKFGMCSSPLSIQHLRRKSKNWFIRNHDNLSEWSDISICRMLFQWASTIKIQVRHVGLVLSRHHYHTIKFNLFSLWYSCEIAHFALNNNHSHTPKCIQFMVHVIVKKYK